MPISIVVGGQFGSEGKGKIAHWLADRQGAKFAVRVGGPNSGHTAISGEKTFALRQLPTPALLGNIVSVIPAGAYLNVDVLLKEVAALNVPAGKLLIHPYAVIIDEWMREEEVTSNLTGRVSSTGQGVGSAVANRAFRNPSVRFAKDHAALSGFLHEKIGRVIEQGLDRGDRVLIEGTQGFGLSNLHSGHYPFATSRDTTAAGALSEAGLSPIDVDCIVQVIRSYPIRVAGNSGPLPNETDWASVTRTSGATKPLSETTTVTGRIRRVASFDPSVVRQAISANRPTHICLNHVDYFDYDIHEQPFISDKAFDRVTEIEESIGQEIAWVGTGPVTTFERPAREFSSVSVT